MGKTLKELFREKAVRKAALINNIEDLNIRVLALTGEIRYLDQELEDIFDIMRLDDTRIKNS